jgi:hypothetical protein
LEFEQDLVPLILDLVSAMTIDSEGIDEQMESQELQAEGGAAVEFEAEAEEGRMPRDFYIPIQCIQ